MTDAPSLQELILPASGSPATQYDTVHGGFRTVLHPTTTAQAPAQFAVRYDDSRLIWVMVQGTHAELLSAKLLEWLWESFLESTQDNDSFSQMLYEYLQTDARKTADTDEEHSLVVGAINRKVEQGNLLIAWLGTAGIRTFNVQRELNALDVGINPGEGWSPKRGIFPAETRPHAQSFILNTVDRLLVFSTALRRVIDEIPSVGRSTLQRIAEAEAVNGTVILFDFHPRQVISQPGDVTVSYRWESPTQVNLSWSGSEEASGFIIEEAPTPQFTYVKVVAELTDHRQRVYTITPPTDRDVYYRVVPTNRNVRGEPSTPVIVTPVPLVPPQIDGITWSDSGRLRVEWSSVPQADTYELEFSPGQDFDSAQTSVVYRGESTFHEVETDEPPTGWYFRVRSRNSHFMPKVPSVWSTPKRAPNRLQTPTFKTVSPALISWTPIDGANKYQVRQKTIDTEKIIAVVERARFNPPPDVEAVYEVRAVRGETDERTASDWSNSVTVGLASSDLPVRSENDEDADTVPLTFLSEKTAKQTPSGNRGFLFIVAVGLITLLLGGVAGLLAGTSFGIGIDPSPTAINDADRQATAAQGIINQENAIARATLSSELNRMSIAATENADQIDTLQTRNANLNNQNTTLIQSQETATAQVGELEATVVYQGTVAVQATDAAEIQATLTAEVDNLQSTIEAYQVTPTATVPAVFGQSVSRPTFVQWLRQFADIVLETTEP